MYLVFIAMLRKSLKQGFSFRNTFSTRSFFEILSHGTKEVHEDQLKDESQTFTWCLCFFIKKVKIYGKDKAYFKTDGQVFLMFVGKKEGTGNLHFLTSQISLSF